MYETLVCTVDESRRRRRRRLRGAARRLICASVIALSEFRFDEWSVSVAAAVPRSTQAQNALLCCSARLLRALIPRAPAPSHSIPFHSIPHSISTSTSTSITRTFRFTSIHSSQAAPHAALAFAFALQQPAAMAMRCFRCERQALHIT